MRKDSGALDEAPDSREHRGAWTDELAEGMNLSGGGRDEAHHHSHCRAFAGSIWPEEPKDNPRGHGEVDAVDGSHATGVLLY